MDFRSFKELVRLPNLLMIGFAVVVGQTIILGRVPLLEEFLLPTVVGMLVGAGAFALNDYTDYDTDVKNRRRDRPLVRGGVSPTSAFVLGGFCFLLGTFAAYFVNQACFVIAFSFALLAVGYDVYLKRVALVGNFAVASTMAVPFIFGSLSLDGLPDVVIVLAGIAFLAGTGRELVKSVQDVEGDKSTGRRTLPVLVGKRQSLALAALFFASAAILSVYPFVCVPAYRYDLYYGVPVGASALLLLSSARHALQGKELSRVRKWTLRGIAVGLLGFFFGILF